MWHREGLFYVARLNWIRGSYKGTVEKRLDFISYHLIRYFHGEQKLRDMALNSVLK